MESPRTLCHVGYMYMYIMTICHWAILHCNMSFQTIAGRSDGVFWWFSALSEDQEKISWIHQNYLVALMVWKTKHYYRALFPLFNQSLFHSLINLFLQKKTRANLLNTFISFYSYMYSLCFHSLHKTYFTNTHTQIHMHIQYFLIVKHILSYMYLVTHTHTHAQHTYNTHTQCMHAHSMY